ncbi:MAG: barstar family protein [Lachnospiraceae bacterium]|jgi:ribonuclease inhibitor|nr:barstar family protein [Lachnospiraceae bacterium]MBR4413074.1 barstar family protein [Lachnospiraceae bacterium]MBR5067468.1 barstar family protein [Lachnospiraceae bacterium]MBR5916645.1 barstar family protein [Lachnospiraceae bacterium]
MEYTIDALKVNERKEAHEYLKEVFSFPEYYGKNLDALFDCLGEMRIDRITIINSEKGENYFYSVLDVINDLGIETVME